MRKFLTTLLIAFTVTSNLAHAAIFPGGPTLTVNGMTFTDLKHLKILYGFIATASRYSVLFNADGTSYQSSTSGNGVLTIYACLEANASSQTDPIVSILYGDTDVGSNSAGAPTNPVFLAGTSTTYASAAHNSALNGTYFNQPINFRFQIPNAKYPTIWANAGNLMVTCYGYENAYAF